MTKRRRLLRGLVSSIAVAAGLGSQYDEDLVAAQSDAPAGDDEPPPEETDSGEDVSGLPGFSVTDVELRYEPHVGITTYVSLENEDENEFDRVRIVTDAYDNGTVVGEDSAWESIPPALERSVKLRIDNIFDLYGAVGRIDEFIIEGRVRDGEYEELERFSGEEFREEIEFDGEVPPDEAEVEVEDEEEDDDEIDIGPDDEEEEEDDEEEEPNGIGDQIENGVPDDIPIGSIPDDITIGSIFD